MANASPGGRVMGDDTLGDQRNSQQFSLGYLTADAEGKRDFNAAYKILLAQKQIQGDDMLLSDSDMLALSKKDKGLSAAD